MKHAIFTEVHRGFPVTIFWIAPNPYRKGVLTYAYRIEDELEVEGFGFMTELAACRAAGAVIDEVHLRMPTRKQRKGSRALGTNPRALGTNPRALRAKQKESIV